MKLLPQWPFEKNEKGRESYASQKANMIYCSVGTIILIIIYGILYFNWFNTIAYDSFKAASRGLKVLSVVCAVLSVWGLWKTPEVKTSERSTWYWVLSIGGAVAAFLCAYIEDTQEG